MKKFFSTILAASLMLLGTQAFAQMSVNAGYLNSTESVKGNSNSVNSHGAFAGVSFNIPIAGGLGIAPGVYYSMITNKDSAAGNIFGLTISGASTFMEHAINAPVYVNYGLDLSRDARFFVYGGPTVQYGLASTTKGEIGIGGSSADKTYNNYDNENYNRFNVYVGGGVGFQAGAFQVTAGYDYGVTDLNKSDNVEAHRSNIKVGVGFLF